MAKGALAQSQFDAGQIAEARQTIRNAIQERDDIAELQLLRAKIELAAKSPATAFTAYSNALSLDSSNGDALLGVAQLGLELGHLRDSEDAVDRILTLDPKQPNALLLKGLHNLVKYRYADALANADAIQAIAPTDESAAILKARALALLDRSNEANATIENARKISGETRGIAITLLELDRQRGDGAAMVVQQERLRKITPGDHNLDIDEADTLYKLGDAARARAILRQLIINKTLDDATASAATRLWQEYDPQPFDANAFAEFAAKAGMPARTATVRYFLDHNDPAQANAALVGAPPSRDVAALRARISVAQNRLDEGLHLAQTILTDDQTHCDALIAKAQADLARRQLDDAITVSQMALHSCPQMISAYIVLARAHELKGNKDGVGVVFRDAFDRNDQDSRLMRIYTNWLEQTGQGMRAVAVAHRLTRNAPSLLSGWNIYLDLCTRMPDADCKSDAETGLAQARRRFGVDPRTDQLASTSLFGRLHRE